MSALTEVEIFSKLEDGFSEAAALCEHISRHTLRGASYRRLIQVCKEIEGACRQAGHWRENYQWFVLGNEVVRLQGKIGDWLRENMSLAAKARSKELFIKAAAKMRELQAKARYARTRKHGKVGQILPVAGEGPMRQRAVQVPRMTPGGIVIPDGVSLQ